MPFSRGSEWRRWDLHVHTPSSLVHHYPGQDPWDHFLTDLSTLPPDLSVVGVNDYLFVDGFDRVRNEHRSGRLPNISVVFPVIELRLDVLVGASRHLGKVNFHVIFDEAMEAEHVDAQFIRGLAPAFHLAPDVEGPTWQGHVSRDNLAAFGASIRATLPPDRQKEFTETDTVLGFNNLCVSRDAVDRCLQQTSLRDRYVTAVGKAEWSSLPWNDQSIALKKDLLNGATIVFTASATPADYRASRESLTEQGVNTSLLDCSDAHAPSSSSEKDRLGNCLTWIKRRSRPLRPETCDH